MPLSNSGIQTKCDALSVSDSVDQLKKTVTNFQLKSVYELKNIFKRNESSGWNFKNAKEDVLKNKNII